MSATCPKGHTSESADYCDVCGARIEGAPPTREAGLDTPAPAASVAPAPDWVTTAGPATGTPPRPAQPDTPAVECPACGTRNTAGTRFCEDCGASLDGDPAAAAPPPATPSTPAGEPGPGAPAWEAVASADRAYFERMEAEGIAFPAVHPDRRFALRGAQVTIGRRSASKGIAPDIDLSAAPEDVGVSHHHAVLVADADGGWSLVDPGSTNGTYLNEGTDPLTVGEAVPLSDGDRIHLGAWTTLTVRRRG